MLLQKSYFLFIGFLLLLISCNQPAGSDRREEARDTTETAGAVEAAYSWEDFQNEAFGVKLRKPASWETLATSPSDAFTILNIYPSNREESVELPLTVHVEAKVSYLSFFPKGFGTELPSGRRVSYAKAEREVPVSFPIKKESSSVFMLENGQIWAYLLRPVRPPSGWDEEGFLFAQVAVEHFDVRCFDDETGEPLPMEDCDHLLGDRIERRGTLIEKEQDAVLHMLQSVQFAGGTKEKPSARETLTVDQPLPKEGVRSPLTVKGKAKGTWFFEGSFPVILLDKEGEVLVRGIAEAQENWMTEAMVPFRATLQFDSPDAERGYLKFEKANPSGLPEHAESFRQEVVFRE